MIIMQTNSPQISNTTLATKSGERGAALAAALLMLGLLSAVAMTVLAVVTTETRVAGSDLKRTQTFYASAAGIEKMTSDYSALFQQSARPTEVQIGAIAADYPSELRDEGFTFAQTIVRDDASLAAMRATQGITDPNKLPTVTLPVDSAYAGLIASVKPYVVTSRATWTQDGTSVALTRTMNNYLIPLFQFGMFSDNDIELHPGATFNFNGRIHANGNIYLAGLVKILDKVTSAHEVIYHKQRNGVDFGQTSVVSMGVGPTAIDVVLNKGSLQSGPHLVCTAPLPPVGDGGPNCFPTSPTGTAWPAATFVWKTTSVKPAVSGTANQFGGQLLTRVTGASKLELPMQLGGNPTRELIKRRLASDNLPAPAETSPLSDSRYHSKAGIRILIDDEGVTNDAAGLYAAQNGDGANTHDGVNLSTFDPIPLPNATAAAGGGRGLWRVSNAGAYTDTALTSVVQQNTGVTGGTAQALTVRGTRGATRNDITPTGSTIAIPRIPAGAGLSGHILIQIADANGVWRDVTKEILSMGVTVGEPNAIIHLQRPLWAAFTQGSRDASGGTNQNLVDILTNTYLGADGEIRTSTAPTQEATYGYLTGLTDDTAAGDVLGSRPIRVDTPPALNISDWGNSAWNTNKRWNTIVPINVYNIREGRLSTSTAAPNLSSNSNAVYERGITSVIEINMKNLARWVDGVYDTNLLAGTPAVSANVTNPDGWVVYVSDRRGDNVKSMTVPDAGSPDPPTFSVIQATNGMVDNVDIYGPNGTMDSGEDVQETGLAVGATLVKDTAELPDPAVLAGTTGTNLLKRNERALTVAAWSNSSNYFRRAVRLFNGADLQTDGAAGNLSTTLGLTISTENMLYTWGNYNTAGINVAPATGVSSLNDPAATSHYMPVGTVLCPSCDRQVPASIVADAWFALSKTWFDSCSAMYPDDLDQRRADLLITGTLPVTSETSVRAGIIAGNNLGAIAGTPDAGNSSNNESRLNGGMHNFPRFLENWGGRFNFAGALIPLYRSTQAVGQYNNNADVYDAPTRNWAFDSTFREPLRLPPGT
ncbi:MAG: hypothetical protein ND895_20355, partial [Pyrinomonadaceae bacterium]|nr:hypothetical protein [Pyrinomonadaceae bacterium]